MKHCFHQIIKPFPPKHPEFAFIITTIIGAKKSNCKMLTQSLVEPLGKCTPPKCRRHKQPGEKRGGFQRRETPSATGNSGNHQIAARSDHQIVARCSCLPFFGLRLCFNIVFFFSIFWWARSNVDLHVADSKWLSESWKDLIGWKDADSKLKLNWRKWSANRIHSGSGRQNPRTNWIWAYINCCWWAVGFPNLTMMKIRTTILLHRLFSYHLSIMPIEWYHYFQVLFINSGKIENATLLVGADKISTKTW